jgi:hypothetical protein
VVFDFSTAQGSVIHDRADPHDGNTFWSGVDFRIFEPNLEIWIEVKSWKFGRGSDQTERKRRSIEFNQKFLDDRLKEFRDDIVIKFLGTSCYLAWSGKGIPERVQYIVFLEPPNVGSQPLVEAFTLELRDAFKNAQARSWGRRITYKVVDLEQFKAEFPNYPVERV